jgi:NAD(P)-dependent dehydrogenase (short-subunit alcohol dehydrogenase family)
MFTYELARHLEGTGVTVTVLHPGVVRTSFGAEEQAVHFAVLIRAPAGHIDAGREGVRQDRSGRPRGSVRVMAQRSWSLGSDPAGARNRRDHFCAVTSPRRHFANQLDHYQPGFLPTRGIELATASWK